MIRCCDMIPQMNHWFRDKSKHFRCAAAGHPYQPWGGNNAKPGYVLCLYGDGGVHYIRAEVPQPAANGKLALLKLMLAEKNLLSIVHDENSYTNFWKHINQICDQEFSMIAKSCPTVYVKVQARQRTSNANNDNEAIHHGPDAVEDGEAWERVVGNFEFGKICMVGGLFANAIKPLSQ